jgi:hypothetical protein
MDSCCMSNATPTVSSEEQGRPVTVLAERYYSIIIIRLLELSFSTVALWRYCSEVHKYVLTLQHVSIPSNSDGFHVFITAKLSFLCAMCELRSFKGKPDR